MRRALAVRLLPVASSDRQGNKHLGPGASRSAPRLRAANRRVVRAMPAAAAKEGEFAARRG